MFGNQGAPLAAVLKIRRYVFPAQTVSAVFICIFRASKKPENTKQTWLLLHASSFVFERLQREALNLPPHSKPLKVREVIYSFRQSTNGGTAIQNTQKMPQRNAGFRQLAFQDEIEKVNRKVSFFLNLTLEDVKSYSHIAGSSTLANGTSLVRNRGLIFHRETVRLSRRGKTK